MANPVPEGFSTITAHITVKNATEAIEFYKNAFGAEEICRMPGPGGMIMHAELRIGNSPLMLNDEFPDMGKRAPADGTPVTIHLYVNDCDALFDRAVKAGAEPLMPPQDTFWGDRYGQVRDPSGHHWGIATHKEDLTPEQIMANAEKAFSGGSC